MNTTLREFTEQRLRALGINAFEAARRAGLERQFVHDIVKGRKKTVLGDNVERLAIALDVSPDELVSASQRQDAQRAARQAEVVPAPEVAIHSLELMPKDLPVLGTTSVAAAKVGDSEAFALDPALAGVRVRRPPVLSDVRDAYAVYVGGDSLAPHHPQGELLLVHPHRVPRPGDTVVIQVKPGDGLPVEAHLKLFVERRGGFIVARQINPKATHRFKEADVVAVHRVLTMNEIFES